MLSDHSIKETIAKNVVEARIVAELNIAQLEPQWEIGTAVLRTQPSVDQLIEITSGYVDTIGGRQAVWSSGNAYLIPGKGNALDFVRPADRSLASSWITGYVPSKIPAFLVLQSKQNEAFLSLMIAVGLEDYFSPVRLRDKCQSLVSLKGTDLAATTELFASIKGISVIVGRRSLQECIVLVEFGTSPEKLKSIAPSVLAEILDHNGTALPEVAEWKVKIDGNKLSLQGAIDEPSLGSLLGIFSLQEQAEQIGQRASTTKMPISSGSPSADASKAYFDGIGLNIEKVRDLHTHRTGERAQWNDQIARRIDRMPTLGIDPELVEYASNIARLLRGNSLNMRNANIAAGVQRTEVASNGYYYGYYNGFNALNTIDARSAGSGSKDFVGILSQIDQLTSDVRRKMTEKLGIQF